MGISPACLELVSVIKNEIEQKGEAVNLKRIVETRSTLSSNYAYRLLRKNKGKLGLKHERLASPRGGYLYRLTHSEDQNDKSV